MPSIAAKPLPQPHPDRRGGWLSPALAQSKQPLFFEADYLLGVVNIFTLPDLTLEGQITGFSEPDGECADKAGNVWVTNIGTSQIFEYARGGTLLRTLSDGYGTVGSCAVDRKSGDLAVTNLHGPSNSPGDVLVFAHATGAPSVYSNPHQGSYYLADYDTRGNLYVDGCTGAPTSLYPCTGAVTLSELPAKRRSMKTIEISGGTIYFPGAVIWSQQNKYLYVFDQGCGDVNSACDYWISISGSIGTIVGSTTFSNYEGGVVCDLTQAAMPRMRQSYVVGGDLGAYCGVSPSVDRWKNPTGGDPLQYYVNSSEIDAPTGSAISEQ